MISTRAQSAHGRRPARRVLCVLALLSAMPLLAADDRVGPVVAIRADRIILMDIEQAGKRLFAVGERGFVLVSDDTGKTWKALPSPVTRTLTGIAFKDARSGIAVGHGASVVRTEDGGQTWQAVAL
jgi:photosystem II stability/assembly factor-like uncharacterized protein